MIRSFFVSRRKRTVSNLTIAVAAAVAALVVAAPSAIAGKGAVAPPPANPTSADQIQNIDQVKTAIKGVLRRHPDVGRRPGSQLDRRRRQDPAHVLADGAYAQEMAGIEDDAVKLLDKRAKQGKFSAQPAIVLDVDDTSMNTYNYEIYSNFVFDPTTQQRVRRRRSVPGRSGNAGSGVPGRDGWLHGLLPDGPAGRRVTTER